MKRILLCLFIILIISLGGYYVYVNYFNKGIPKLETEDEKVGVNKYYVYGNHFNLSGSVKLNDLTYKDVVLTLYNGEFKDYKINSELNSNVLSFELSEYINDGIYLDNIEKGMYYIFLKVIYVDEEKENDKYYVINNETEYNDISYYTYSKYNNKVIINSDNDYETMMFNVTENKDSDIYDVTIDPGHGGMDSGAYVNGHKESDVTMEISRMVADNLVNSNIKVKLTHEENDIPSDQVMEEYNTHGRAVIPNEVKSKYTFSIHINKNVSTNVHGIEIYTPNNIDYEFAKKMATNITDSSGLGYSTNKTFKKYDGVYTHNFTEAEINKSLADYEKKGYKPYNVTTNSNYLYMIRETGGIMTGAYVEEGNEKVGTNSYYNSNIGNESYLLELGYLSNNSDFNIIMNNKDKIAKAISDTIIEELNSNV